jgi:hypothetical protein
VLKPRRPWSVTWLALFVLIIAGSNLIRFIEAIRQWQFLSETIRVSSLYIAISGLIWALVGFPLSWAIWRGWRNSPVWTLAATCVYSIYYWFDHLVMARDSLSNWRFAIVLNAIIILVLITVFTRRKVKTFMGVTHET